ncbi:hypothetical protein [Erythrobacter crassostreae]|uniref:Uncharacterized protein n=1 Tax=Erythrobacter crassostreae TaxID=2828328 RepID=A0A9X1JPE8_9SPHN|nr:hypothetical protein [Erythrobacter crassostrea]MBV7259357.1 hypothetical protein [Erythrobacter crassostrea]
MQTEFTAQLKQLNTSECERLCVKGSRDITILAQQAGWHGLQGQSVNPSIGIAINMMVLAIAGDHGVEPRVMAPRFPGLRNEVLLRLGEDHSNWGIDATYDASRQFNANLYGDRSTIRPFLASTLGCCQHTTTKRLRFHSANDIEELSNEEFERSNLTRAPHFSIDAKELCHRISLNVAGPFFTAKQKAWF